MLKKKTFWFLSASLLLAVLLVPVLVKVAPPVTNLDNNWAWGSNYGWLSLGNGTAANHRVLIDSTTGVATGYGWSDNLGWLRFGSDLAGPTGGGDNYSARFVGNDLKGWARFCSVFTTGCSGTLRDNSSRGGWDGWLKMVNVAYDATTQKVTGFGWGSLVSGWTKFGASNMTSPLDVVCVGEKGADGNTIVWAARAINGSGMFNYVWSGTGTGDDNFGPIVVTDVLATSTYTKTYGASPARTVYSSVTVSQGSWSKVCNSSATVGSGGCTTNCGGHSFSARCAVSPATVMVGGSTNWTSAYSYGTPVTYQWSGYTVNNGSAFTETLDSSLHPLVGKGTKDVLGAVFNTPGNYAGRVTMTTAGGDKAVSDYCSAGANKHHVTVGNSGCYVNLTVSNPTTPVGKVKYRKTDESSYLGTYSAGTTKIEVDCGREYTFESVNYSDGVTPLTITWATSDGNPRASLVKVTVDAGTKNVSAGFGGGFDFTITGGRTATKNLIVWDNPGEYPAPTSIGNKDYVKISSNSGQKAIITAIDLTSLSELSDEISCASPQLAIEDPITKEINTITAGAEYDTIIQPKMLIYFPNKCVGANGQSVFYWISSYPIKLTVKTADGGTTELLTFKIIFNDSTKGTSNTLR